MYHTLSFGKRPIAITERKANKKYSILADHLGTPTQMYNEEGESIWERSLDMNGKVQEGSHRGCPFMYQGQYYDEEIELAYNRFRYYDPEEGRYISQDPIGLLSGEYGFYNYVEDTNDSFDPHGLVQYHRRDGTFGKKRGRPKKKKTSTNGNSHQSKKKNYLYARFDAEGNFLKWGKTQDMKGRYSSTELNGGKIVDLADGNIKDIKKIERELSEKRGGDLNKESWAKTKKRSGIKS